MARSHAQDKACIDQSNINSDLRCLPIFLSGCRSLVVLAGPTYSQRLWCVLEIFVFLRTGGTEERVVVHHLGGENVHKSLTQFDASKAKCFLHSDRHRLLAVIEAAFGDCMCACPHRRRWAPIVPYGILFTPAYRPPVASRSVCSFREPRLVRPFNKLVRGLLSKAKGGGAKTDERDELLHQTV